MLLNEELNVNPEIKRLINDVISEYQCFDNDMRTSIRKPFSCPVVICIGDDRVVMNGFSRNVSMSGISLVTTSNLSRGVVAKLQIQRLNGPSTEIMAECRWCRSFGEGFYVSGWKFVVPKR